MGEAKMKWAVMSNQGWFCSTEKGITQDVRKARWFSYLDATKLKKQMNRKTNPRMTWKVVRLNDDGTVQGNS